MSINLNRAKLRKAVTSSNWSRMKLNILYPIYWDEGYTFRKGHSPHKYRSYRSWKYNRKNQYKMVI